MKCRTIIFSEEQIQGLLGIIETQGQEWDKYGRAGWENYTALAFVVPERDVAQVTLLFKRRKSGIVKA